jgi:trimethylamine:corrinoid methyltransferase-like protein
MLNEYQQPPLDPAIEEQLVAYADQRRPTLLANVG